MEGVRTEELSGSNLHKLSKSSYQKEWENFSHSLLILYQILKRMSSYFYTLFNLCENIFFLNLSLLSHL